VAVGCQKWDSVGRFYRNREYRQRESKRSSLESSFLDTVSTHTMSTMQASRIAELLDPFLGPPEARRMTPAALDLISTYIDILQRWNARINLTAIRKPEEIVTRHFGESLFAARQLFPGGVRVTHALSRAGSTPETDRALAPAVADIGSGAGFPGIPIKLWAPEISLTLIESNHKKATFLRELTRTLTLTHVNIQNTRAESLAPSCFDVVTLRAVERFPSILPVAASLVAPAGSMALLIGRAQLPQAQSTLPSLNWSVPVPIPESQSRVLAIAFRNNP
jgi:16S rRNA (guanine527-N7)-methyltransferase